MREHVKAPTMVHSIILSLCQPWKVAIQALTEHWVSFIADRIGFVFYFSLARPNIKAVPTERKNVTVKGTMESTT